MEHHYSRKSVVTDVKNFDKYMSIGDIRITPTMVRFDGAFVGRRFRESITIQNCGKESVFIRILKPTLYGIQMQALVNGEFLAPGMKICRVIKYQTQRLHDSATGIIPVIINGRKVEYPIEVLFAREQVTVEPAVIDFGIINVDTLSEHKEFTIANVGSKVASFVMDTIHSDNLIILVSPSKGHLDSKQAVQCNVCLVCSDEGDFEIEMWMRGSIATRILLIFKVVEPRWTVLHAKSCPIFSVVEFPATYLGSWSERRIVVKNSSATKLMFCFMGEYDFEEYSVEEADKMYNSEKTFHVSPVQGILLPTESKILSFRFEPKNANLPQGRNFCTLKLIGLDFQPVKKFEIPKKSLRPKRHSIISETVSLHSEPTKTSLQSENFSWKNVKRNKNEMTIYLFGLAESARVKITPESLSIGPVPLKGRESRLLLIKNLSDRLPVVFSYKKTASIRIIPSQKLLKPLQSVEVQLICSANQPGHLSKRITFKLLHQQYENSQYVPVGVAEVIVMLTCVAKTVYPVRVDECKRLLLDRPAVGQISLSKVGMENFNRADQISCAKHITDDYEIANKKLLLARDIKCRPCRIVKKEECEFSSSLLPLTILQLYKIQIYPKCINIGKIARQSTWNQRMFMKNGNDLPVIVTLQPHSESIMCSNFHNFKLDRKSEHACDIELKSSNVDGLFDVIVDIILNQSFVDKAIITGEVIAKSVIFDKTELTFDHVEGYEQYIDLYNPYDTNVVYTVHTLSEGFRTNSRIAEIEGPNHHTIVVTCDPEISERDRELTVQIEGNLLQSIPLIVPVHTHSVRLLEKKLSLDNLPLNIKKKVYLHLENEGFNYVSFSIMNPDFLPGITISPNEDTLKPKSIYELTISIKIPVCVNFKKNLDILVGSNHILTFYIVGNVCFPKLEIVPDKIPFAKITPCSIDRKKFTIKNNGVSEASVKFLLDDYKEYKIFEKDSAKAQDKVPLMPKEKKEFILLFRPVDIINLTFNLPILVNDILFGKYEEYEEGVVKYKGIKDVIVKDVEKIVVPEVTSRVTELLLWISQKELKFFVSPLDPKNSLTEDKLTLINKSDKTIHVGLKIDQIDDFKISYNDSEIEYANGVIHKTLEVLGRIELTVTFEPKTEGSSEQEIPIHVKDYEHKIYSVVALRGALLTPQFLSDSVVVYLEPVPVTCVSSKTFTVKLEHHSKNCECRVISTHGNLKVTTTKESTNPASVKLHFEYSSRQPGDLSTTVILKCTCGGKKEISVKGCTENSVITNHAFLFSKGVKVLNYDFFTSKARISFKDEYNVEPSTSTGEDYSKIFRINASNSSTSFPLFPSENDVFKSYMLDIVKSLESWIYTQVFYYKKYLQIPQGFTMNLEQIPKEKDDDVTMPYLLLLGNLTENRIVKKIIDQIKLENTLDDPVYYKYIAYHKSKNLLISSGGVLPNVEPEYLLTFDEFNSLLNMTFDVVEKNPFSEEEFKLLSLQNWVDFLLQTFKVFGLKRSIFAKQPSVSKIASHPTISTIVESKIDHIIYSREEHALLLWLEGNYNSFRYTLCETLPSKTVKLFNSDLDDGIILMVVTVAFCPYIKEEFATCYYPATNEEQAVHNISKLLEAWKKIGSKFMITVSELMAANSIQMIMLVTYLYTFLPTLLPSESISLHAGINESCTHVITLTNENPYTIKYSVIIFNNFSNSLSCSHDSCILKPKQSVEVEITFTVIHMKNFTAVLLFSGESQGYPYASSLAFELYANSDITSGYQEVVIPCKLSEIEEADIIVNKKYPEPCELEVFYFKSLHEKDMFPSRTLSQAEIPASLHFNTGLTMVVDEEGVAKCKLQYCFFRNALEWPVYFLLRHKEYGDSGIMLRFQSQDSKPPPETLSLQVSTSSFTSQCLCNTPLKSMCPKTVFLEIPSRNDVFWDRLEDMFLDQVLSSSRPSYDYWKANFKEFSTVSILQSRMRSIGYYYRTYPYNFTGVVTRFFVKILKPSKGISSVPYIDFSCSEPNKFTKLPLHLDSGKVPETILLELVSEIYEEHRVYNVKISRNI